MLCSISSVSCVFLVRPFFNNIHFHSFPCLLSFLFDLLMRNCSSDLKIHLIRPFWDLDKETGINTHSRQYYSLLSMEPLNYDFQKEFALIDDWVNDFSLWSKNRFTMPNVYNSFIKSRKSFYFIRGRRNTYKLAHWAIAQQSVVVNLSLHIVINYRLVHIVIRKMHAICSAAEKPHSRRKANGERSKWFSWRNNSHSHKSKRFKWSGCWIRERECRIHSVHTTILI